MASSYYWANKKNEAWRKYQQYGNQYNELKDIRGGLDQSGCVKDSNWSIEKCISSMKSALTGSSKFTTNANAIGNHKVQSYGATPKLNGAYSSINSEMTRISNAKDRAYNDYTYYKRMEREARQAEMELAQG